MFLRSRSGEASLRAVGFQAPEVARCFVRLVNVGIAAHDSDSDPHGILSADAPSTPREARELLCDAAEGVAYYDSLRKKLEEAAPAV